MARSVTLATKSTLSLAWTGP